MDGWMERQTDITVIKLQTSDISTFYKQKGLYNNREQTCGTREKRNNAKSYIEVFPLH